MTYKYFIILFIGLTFTTKTNCQTFPAADWRQGIYFHGNFYQSPPDASLSIQYFGDTSLCGFTYNKILCQPAWPGNPASYRYIRKDSGKVYLFQSFCSNPEILLYDFNLNINDTFQQQYSYCYGIDYIVDTTYSITLINNDVRKFIMLVPLDTNWGYDTIRWIEDIGDIKRGFFPQCDFEGGHSHFICHKENGELLWLDTLNQTIVNCDSITQIIATGLTNENQANPDLFVFPNPAKDFINIQSNFSGKLYTIIVYDISSRVLLKKDFVTNDEINIFDFSKGLYFYQIRNIDEILFNGKLIKE
jgi:hypothetical protein